MTKPPNLSRRPLVVTISTVIKIILCYVSRRVVQRRQAIFLFPIIHGSIVYAYKL